VVEGLTHDELSYPGLSWDIQATFVILVIGARGGSVGAPRFCLVWQRNSSERGVRA
jgi:hypothetical protein